MTRNKPVKDGILDGKMHSASDGASDGALDGALDDISDSRLAGRLKPACLSIPIGHTLMLDASNFSRSTRLRVSEGLIRVAFSSVHIEPMEAEPITLGFLQSGDQLPLELLRHSWLHLEAIKTTSLTDTSELSQGVEAISLNDWTASLLMIQHLNDSQQRLRALLHLLVDRLGQRCGSWYELPMRLKHERLAEMVNHTRVTVSRHMSRWRQAGLIDSEHHEHGHLRIAPELLDL
jgi:hypothetical protein